MTKPNHMEKKEMRRRGKAFILALLILPLAMTTMAQELKKPTLEDLLPGGETYRYAQNIYGLQWWGRLLYQA